MAAHLPQLPRVILYEGKDSQPFAAEVRQELMVKLLDKGYTVSRATEKGRLENLGHEKVIVVGVFDLAMQPVASDSIHVQDVRGQSSESILKTVESIAQPAGQDSAAAPKRWKPWFPVIDYDRCTNCMQCLSFCLFDVYGVTKGGKIQVQNQTNCKTDCPACSRVCPEVAILFPKYKAGPINGDEINQDDIRREAMKVDISSLLGGDIYSMLRDRSEKAKSRFSKERDDDRALKERQRCLDKLKSNFDALDIPTEVLSSLPSMDQIQAKAQKAKERAQQALEMQASNLQHVADRDVVAKDVVEYDDVSANPPVNPN
jgi:NAD-dependent dihydropyrimidine dehydrogenase PreA subunit